MKSKTFALITVVLSLMLLPACNRSKMAAEDGLAKLKHLLKNGANNGSFVSKVLSTQEIDALTLGDGIKVYTLPLDSIKMYNSNADNLLIDENQFIYPILSNGVVVTSEKVALMQPGGKWKVRSYGDQLTIQTYYMEGGNKFAPSYRPKSYLVEVPSLSVDFLIDKAHSPFQLLYLGTNTFDSISPAKAETLDDVVRKLQPEAKNLHPL